MYDLEARIRELPPDLRQEAVDFVEFLMTKRQKQERRVPSFTWAGALRHLRGQYTSVDLQHELAAWRVAEE